MGITKDDKTYLLSERVTTDWGLRMVQNRQREGRCIHGHIHKYRKIKKKRNGDRKQRNIQNNTFSPTPFFTFSKI